MAKLFYIIGASGAGKDTLMNYARNAVKPTNIIFAHRYITRPPFSGNENHVSLSENEFRTRLEAGLFALNWQSHGNHYGIGIEINYWMQNGFNVVINGSREYLAFAKTRYPELTVILIKISPQVLYKRLQVRGRESESEIQKRLQRSNEINITLDNCIHIQNDSSVEEAGNQLVEVITS